MFFDEKSTCGRLIARARPKLEQRRSRTFPSLLALLTNQSPGEVVHACSRHVAQCGEVNVARRQATRALDLQPRVFETVRVTQMSSRYVRYARNAVGARSRDHRAERSSVLGICFWPFIVRQHAPIVHPLLARPRPTPQPLPRERFRSMTRTGRRAAFGLGEKFEKSARRFRWSNRRSFDKLPFEASYRSVADTKIEMAQPRLALATAHRLRSASQSHEPDRGVNRALRSRPEIVRCPGSCMI
jgi:hypothetical protein